MAGTRAKRKPYVFIAHAAADREWVRGYLIPAVGLPRAQVMTSDEFRPGAPIVEELSAAVGSSRYTIIVLSEAFVADEWAQFGEVLASHQSVSSRSDGTIVVLLQPCRVPAHVELRVRLDCTDEANWAAELRRLRELLRRPEPHDETPACPYPGMRPFRTDEAYLFHGRQAEVSEMARRLRHQSVLFVIGPSGVGKSSLVFAGLVPLLQRHGVWLVRYMRPGGRPLESLARALDDAETDALTPARSRALVERALSEQPSGTRLVLIVDQLEEAFLEVPDDERRAFLSVVADLCRNPRCVPIITMRADFYPDLMTSELWPLARDGRAEVTPLRREQLREAILRPASTVGVYLEPGLTERLLGDSAEEPGALPLVQETMVLLWEQRQRRLLTLRSYERLGNDRQSGLAVALATVADGALTDLSDVQRRVARRILLRLVQFGEGRDDTRRQQTVGALRAAAEPPELFDATLLHLTRRRVLTLSGEEEVEARKVDLAHESLITGWTTLRRWLDEDREGLRLQRQLERDAEEWQRFGRDSGVLYRGARLQAAGEWIEQHAEEVTELERGFIVASRAEAASHRIPSAGGSPWQEALTEADLVQLLYAELHPVFGYDAVNLQVLEREGWYHSQAIEQGVLQDLRRRPLSDSAFVDAYRELTPRVIERGPGDPFLPARGAPATGPPRIMVWLPLLHAGRPIGSISYQMYTPRKVPPEELQFLERMHEHLALVVSNAYLNDLTRNQSVSLSALNAIARALSATHDEEGIVRALMTTLSALIPIERIELVVRQHPTSARMRLLEGGVDGPPRRSWTSHRSRGLRRARAVLDSGIARLDLERTASAQYRSTVMVPIVELGGVRGVLAASTRQPDAYERSTVAFLQQVADQVALALRNAWSYAAIESQRRRLEVVNAVGRRLASTLDRRSIMRILREELARHLEFDLFTLAAVTETSDGPVAEGLVWDSGEEVPSPPVPLALAGPARQAYENARPVLIRRAPWSRQVEARRPRRGERVRAAGVLVDITQPRSRSRLVARSVLWVPVRQGEEITALLSVQSYREDMFDEWHVQVLEDVGAQVGLALANAEHYREAQSERHRLGVLHRLELGLAGAADEMQIAQAFVQEVGAFVQAEILLLGYFDSRGRFTGYGTGEDGQLRRLEPVVIERTAYLRRIVVDRVTIAESLPPELRQQLPAEGWPTWGPPIPSQVVIVPLFDDDRVVGVLSAQRMADVPFSSEEIRLLESASSVVDIALRTVRLQEAKDLMLRAIGKEVRSPAAAMRWTIAGLIQWGDVIDADQRRVLVQEAYEQSERLQSLVEVQLQIASLETRRFEPNRQPVSVRRSAEQVLAVLRSRYGRRVENVDAAFRTDLPDAYCEPIHLDQVLANLIGNALEHTTAGRIDVQARVAGDAIEVTVSDTGGGIPPDYVRHLFSKSMPAGRGLGLGLYLCHLIVERSFDGRIWLESTGPSGTTFRFTVAAAP